MIYSRRVQMRCGWVKLGSRLCSPKMNQVILQLKQLLLIMLWVFEVAGLATLIVLLVCAELNAEQPGKKGEYLHHEPCSIISSAPVSGLSR